MKILLSVFLFLASAMSALAQNVAINNTGEAPDPKAMLDIKAVGKGVLLPRMLEADKFNITGSVPLGLVIFQTDGDRGLYFNASALPSIPNWKKIAVSEENFWQYASPNYLYTNAAFNVGIGTAAPQAKLHVFGPAAEKLRLENSAALANDVKTELYFKTGDYFTGAIKTIGNGSSVARLGLFAYAGASTTLKEYVSIMDGGNVGMGTTNPLFRLTVKADNQGIMQESLDGTMQLGLYTNTTSGAVVQTNTNHALNLATNNGLPQATLLTNGNFGIGTALPANKLTVRADNIGIAQESADGLVRVGFFASSAGAFVQTHSNHALNFTTNNGATQATLSTTGNLGIGNTAPTLGGLIVDKKIGATNAMFGSNTTGVAIETSWPGVAFNSYYGSTRKAIATGYGGLIGMNPTNGDFYVQSASASTNAGADMATSSRMLIDKDGDVGIEGNTTPHSPLCFGNFFGNKISLYGSTATQNYGLGMGTGTMQLYTPAGADIAFGTGVSTSFTENVRIKGSGAVGIGTNAPSEKLEIFKGRIRFKGNVSAVVSHGITWSNNAGTADKSFIGQYDDNTFGFYGYGGAGWNFLWDVNDGSLRLGTAQKAAGYMLNVGGKAIAEEVRVQLRAAWPDYVFTPGYKLLPLDQLEAYLNTNSHLPNIPAATVLEKEGTDLGEMQRKMMEKIEELTLYIIDLKKEMNELKKSVPTVNK